MSVRNETRDPVTLTRHLVLGRERDFALFHNFKHVYSPRTRAYNYVVQVLAEFKAFIIPTILYQVQKYLFCLIILYDILFHFIHVYKAPGQGQTAIGAFFIFFFYGSRKVLSL